MIQSGVTAGTPARIQFGAAVFFENVKYDEKVAPTDAEILTGLIGATQEGGKITITPEIFRPDLDGVTVAVKELEQKTGEMAVMETNMVEVTPERVAKSLIGQIGASTDGNYDVITSSELRAGHYYSGFGCKTTLMDGRGLICIFKNARCTNGFNIEPKNKQNGAFAGVFECVSDIEYGVTKLPYALFIHKEKGWVKTTPEEITNTGAA